MPGQEYTPHRGHAIAPMGQFRCTCGAIWDLHGQIQFHPTAHPVNPETNALIPKPTKDPRRIETKKP